MKYSQIEQILTQITQWSSENLNIIGLALVGSYARGNARSDSDIDLMLITPNPWLFRQNMKWIYEIDWKHINLNIKDWKDSDYGVVWSRHIYFVEQTKIEFSFGLPTWTSINPVDRGTLNVVKNGIKILYDPQKVFHNLLNEIKTV